MTRIDWSSIAASVGIDGNSGSGTKAREAIAMLLGDTALREAVDYYISGADGSELARHVLWQLHPWVAMDYCKEIALSNAPEPDRVSAVELLRVVADERALHWIPEFLETQIADVQMWGFAILDQLFQSGFIEASEATEIVRLGMTHSNQKVREQAAEFQQRLKESQ